MGTFLAPFFVFLGVLDGKLCDWELRKKGKEGRRSGNDGNVGEKGRKRELKGKKRGDDRGMTEM